MKSLPKDFTIENVFPWGRSFDEYQRMFALSAEDLERKILGCADGPAAFNAEMHRQGKRVVSFDPLYQFDAAAIRRRVTATAPEMIRQAKENAHRFVWERIKSPEHMAELRLGSMEIFLADYEIGKTQGRYVNESLPRLSFHDGQFDLALCSHFLFLYSHELTLEFHLQAIRELSRVAGEVRIFPVLGMDGEISPHVETVIEEMRHAGFEAEACSVDYEFQRRGNRMMRLRHKIGSHC
jgi:hypothetical protein